MRRLGAITVRKDLWLAILLAAGVNSAQAADWYTGAPTAEDRDNWIVSVDASTSFTSTNSVFVNAGATAALGGTMQESGGRMRAEGMVGSYEYTTSATTTPVVAAAKKIRADQIEGAALAGYEWVGPDTKIAGFLGLSLRNTTLSAIDPLNQVQGTSFGVKAAIDYYARPSEKIMVAAYGSITTNNKAYFGRVKAGYRVFGDIYVGPELAVLGNDFFKQWRLGAHLSGLQLGPIQASISAGYLADAAQKNGMYTSLDVRTQF